MAGGMNGVVWDFDPLCVLIRRDKQKRQQVKTEVDIGVVSAHHDKDQSLPDLESDK